MGWWKVVDKNLGFHIASWKSLIPISTLNDLKLHFEIRGALKERNTIQNSNQQIHTQWKTLPLYQKIGEWMYI